VGGDADAAPALHRQDVVEHVVVARVDAQVAQLPEAHELVEIGVGLLHGDYVFGLG
jgi:uncharacterized Rossmann fold enzyme